MILTSEDIIMQRGSDKRIGAVGWLVLLQTLLLAAASAGSTVVPMTVTTLSDHAGQVIVGEIASVRSYWVNQPRRIESEVLLQNVGYLKGRLRDSTPTFRLIVPGGSVGDTPMRIASAPVFKVGEKWILFLLPTYRTFPVVGLYQGAFRLERDTEGVERVCDAAGNPVLGLDADGFVQIALPASTMGAGYYWAGLGGPP